MNNGSIAKILDGLQTAMRAEHEGYHFYMMAAQNTEDVKGREVFKQMANDELEHLRFLQAQYDSIKDTQAPNPHLQLPSMVVLEGPNPIFSDGIKSRITNAHYEMTALSVGAQLERDAQAVYGKFADEAQDPVVEKFYRELAAWEGEHCRILLAQQDSLKDEYWTGNNFSPF